MHTDFAPGDFHHFNRINHVYRFYNFGLVARAERFTVSRVSRLLKFRMCGIFLERRHPSQIVTKNGLLNFLVELPRAH